MLWLFSTKHWVVGDFLEHWKGGTEVLVLMEQGIFFTSLSLSQVLLSHPSTSDLRITINHLLLFRWICLCQIVGWFLHWEGKDFGGKPKAQPFSAGDGWKRKSVFLIYSPGHELERSLFMTGCKLGLLYLTECCKSHCCSSHLPSVFSCSLTFEDTAGGEVCFPSSWALHPHMCDNLSVVHHWARYLYSARSESGEVCFKC